MVMNLHSCKVAVLDAAYLGADSRTGRELDHYCESFGLRLNWDILADSTCTLAVILWARDFALDKT
jgi:hypothetical protein